MRTRAQRRGFTLVEGAIALVLVTIVVVKLAMLMRMSGESSATEISETVVEDQARRLIDRIGFAIMGADESQLIPNPLTPIDSPDLSFRVSLGVDEDGAKAWSDAQWIGLQATHELSWRERPDQEGERRVVWSNAVRELLAGEVQNGKDDNGNGVIDERGLSFTVDGSRVIVRLTLERPSRDGRLVACNVETTVTCRN